MNDFDYDCLQKKRIAHQAKYRKRGSKSKRCSMSTDYMTTKQWKERNGKVVSVNFDKPTSWANFKELSRGAQEEYLHYLATVYGANATNLAEMFDTSVTTIRRYIQANELNIKFHVGHSMNAEQKAAWESFLNSGEGTPTDRVQKPIQKKSAMQMNKFSLCFTGVIDVDMIANSIRHILGGNASGQVEIVCSLMEFR